MHPIYIWSKTLPFICTPLHALLCNSLFAIRWLLPHATGFLQVQLTNHSYVHLQSCKIVSLFLWVGMIQKYLNTTILETKGLHRNFLHYSIPCSHALTATLYIHTFTAHVRNFCSVLFFSPAATIFM